MRILSALAVLVLMGPLNANAYWTGEFKPIGPYVSGAENFHFRVDGVPATANCVSSFAFINKSDGGSSVKIATLLLAYAQGKKIDLYVDKEASGYCRIIEFVVK